jgi:uncharacterized protein (DUF362 family)/Pyruvate/2-oxoacid:ferredoxin oxidoreductase delta subunit
MAQVLVRKADYTYAALRPVLFELMDRLGGQRIEQNSRVLIKPNLLAAASPEQAVVTHPLIVKAVAEYVLGKGARVQISDSPAVGSFEKILTESGLREALEGLDVEFKEFRESRSVDVGKPFEKLDIAADALNADIVINLPKLKTHTHMLLTLGIKNLFGCIVGMKKPEWHLRSGVNREMFAQLLVKIYQAVNPSITIMDGIIAMEGQGPGKRGEPRELGLLLGSSNAAALDMTICRMLNVSPDEVLTNRFAKEAGLIEGEITVDGHLPAVNNYKLPRITSMVFGPPRFHRFIRRHLIQRPECDDALCKVCGECWKYCPAQAITHKEKKLHFDYDRCIRCYCCVEVCPHGALSAEETLTGKITRKVIKL